VIGFLRGQLVKKQPPMIWLDVQGVGYEVEAPMSTFYQLEKTDGDITLLTHMHVREDVMLLFGFASEAEKTLFQTLIKVNGVGAKMALGILSAMSVNEFCQHVNHDDVTALTRIPGVGKKTAERLLIEMRDRLKPLMESGALGESEFALTSPGFESDAHISSNNIQVSAAEALVALGYKGNQAEKMVKSVYEEGQSLEAVIKLALQGVKL
jgi:Holliday junction DNA helicase RuvA